MTEEDPYMKAFIEAGVPPATWSELCEIIELMCHGCCDLDDDHRLVRIVNVITDTPLEYDDDKRNPEFNDEELDEDE